MSVFHPAEEPAEDSKVLGNDGTTNTHETSCEKEIDFCSGKSLRFGVYSLQQQVSYTLINIMCQKISTMSGTELKCEYQVVCLDLPEKEVLRDQTA